MTKLKFPQSDRARLAVLQQTAQALITNLMTYVSEETRSKIDTFLPLYEQMAGSYERARALRKSSTTARDEAVRQLSYATSDFCSNVKRHVRREGLPKSLLSSYLMTSKGKAPRGGSVCEQIHRARRLADIDAKAASLGMTRMLNPSARELLHLAEVAEIAQGRAMTAWRQVQELQTAMEEIWRPEAKRLVYRVRDELQMELRGEGSAFRRKVLLKFGFSFSGGSSPGAEAKGGEERERVTADREAA